MMMAMLAALLTTPAALAEPPEPLSPNCQAPLELAEEVARLLHTAASHATSSAACIDGPGSHFVVDDIRVCPARSHEDLVSVHATYTVTEWAEGDTRMCGARLHPPGGRPEAASLPDLCTGTPAVAAHGASFSFRRGGGGLLLDVPEAVPGLEGMTPLDQEHQGGCYGPSGPFVPRPVRAH